MPTPRKTPAHYPVEYSELLRRAVHEPQEVNLHRPERAAAFRKSLYAFRESLEDCPEFDVELLLIARQATFIVEGPICRVVVPEMSSVEEFK